MSKLTEYSPERVAYNGLYGLVAYAQVLDGTYPAEEFVDSFSDSCSAKFISQFIAITNNHNLQLLNKQQFKRVEGDLFEFKRIDIQMRLFTFRTGNCWYLVLGFAGKKENKLPQGIVRQALRLMDEAKKCLKKKGAM